MRAIALVAALVAGCGANPCGAGCEDTLAAGCANGPSSQEVCESDCEGQRSGPCAAEYDALLACDGTVECDVQGYPAVAGCETEQEAFTACLTGT